jgi:hypothetical protein
VVTAPPVITIRAWHRAPELGERTAVADTGSVVGPNDSAGNDSVWRVMVPSGSVKLPPWRFAGSSRRAT